MSLALLILTAWACLAFGSVYPWANVPLLGGASVCGTLAARRVSDWSALYPLLALVALFIAVMLQLIPLPTGVMQTAAPNNYEAAQRLDLSLVPVDVASLASYQLSISPTLTTRAAMFFAVYALLWWGVHQYFSRVGCKTFVQGLLLVGALVALLGIVQRALFNGKVLWIWTPYFGAENSFGPFINRNHFAGWMVLATGLGAGYACGLLAIRRGPTAITWNQRLLWLSTPVGGRLTLATGALAAMAIATVWTMSRSGIAGLTVTATVLMWFALRHRNSRRSLATVSLLVCILVGSLVWRGPARLADWYGVTDTLQWRFELWRDSRLPLADFWVFGSGLNTYGQVMLLYPLSVWPHPQQAHNDYVQLAVEGGLLVGIPALVACWVFGRHVQRRLTSDSSVRTFWHRVGAVAGILGIALQEVSDFSLQIPGVALLFIFALAVATHKDPQEISPGRSPSIATPADGEVRRLPQEAI